MNIKYTDCHIKAQLSTQPEQAFEALFRKYFPYLCSTIYQVLPQAAIAEDLTQDLFLDLWKRRKKIAISGSLKAYLRKAAIHKALNQQRALKRRQDRQQIWLQRAGSSTTKPLEINELLGYIQQAIDQLPERCRLVFILSRHEDLSYREIAQLLNISEKTVDHQMRKALQFLRQKLVLYGQE